jgi:hypothetical protein
MFADPQSVTISGTATSLPRISAGEMNGKFRAGDGATVMTIEHSSNRRERSVVRLDSNIVGADPLDTTKQRNYKLGAYLVLDAPLNGVGFSAAQKQALITALADWLKAAGNTAKFVGSES